MAFNEQAQAITLTATAAVTKARFILIDGVRTASVAADATDLDGVSGETVVAGDVFPGVYSGVTQIELGATLAAGVRVTSNATGQAVAAGAAGTVTGGKLIEGGASGEIVAMLVDIRRQHA